MQFSDLLPKLPAKYSKLTQEQRARVRAAFVGRQGGKCLFCGGMLNNPPRDKRTVSASLFPKGFFSHPIHLHHDHKTDDTLGAVHAHCNAVLWQYFGE